MFLPGMPVAKPLNHPPELSHSTGTPASRNARIAALPTLTLLNTATWEMSIRRRLATSAPSSIRSTLPAFLVRRDPGVVR